MKPDLQYTDPRLAALYDINNPRGSDTDFYVKLAEEIRAKTIIDLGCGTGLLTRELAVNGRQVTGIDPAPSMLECAKHQDKRNSVLWKEGDASILGTPEADLVLVTGNAVQVFLEDNEWYAVLRAIHNALRQGGYIAFESRNPTAKVWESWNPESTYKLIDSPSGKVEYWIELISAGNSRVRFNSHYVFNKTGEVLTGESELRFRSAEEISNQLRDTGFCRQEVYGGWNREPITEDSKVMVFTAQRC